MGHSKKLIAPYIFVFASCLLLTPLISGCATVYNPATGQQELILIDSVSELSLGSRVSASIDREYRLSEDPRYSERVNSIGQNIAAVCDRRDIPYHFKVIKDSEVNAFSTLGGYVYVFTGLIERVNDDELACVLAHEVGHIAARHSVKKLQVDMGYNILMSIAFAKGANADLQKAIDITFELASLGYSREDEFLADRLAVRYAYKAGYEPDAMISFMEKLGELEKEKVVIAPIFLRSHPYLKDRINKVRNEISQLKGKTAQAKPTGFTKGKFCPECGAYYGENFEYCPKDRGKLLYRQ